jgi:hypothetical protein
VLASQKPEVTLDALEKATVRLKPDPTGVGGGGGGGGAPPPPPPAARGAGRASS